MKRFLPDSIFARLFALVLVAIVVSHLMTFVLVGSFFGRGFPRPPDAQGNPPPPATWSRDRAYPSPPGGSAHDHGRLPPRPMLWIAGHAVPLPSPGLWIGFIVQVVALSLAAWFGAKSVARPIQRLARGAAQLGEDLNSPPIEERGPSETRQAAQVFNQMQKRVRSHIEERGRFLAAVSHDLRTPLTRMKLRVERLTEEIPKQKLRTNIIEMTVLLDLTLEYLRGEASIESWQVLDVNALIDSMVEDARENGGKISVSGATKPLLTKPMALRRCLSNLMENAMRYGEKVNISLVDTPNMLTIEVHDEGPGIPEEMMNAVFEPFVRLETSRNKAFGGVGLGLSIAREAASQCGGNLTLRNSEQGGLIACISVPRHN